MTPSKPHTHGGDLHRATARFGRSHFLDFSSNLNPFAHFPLPDSPELHASVSRYPSAGADDLLPCLAAATNHPAHQLIPTAGAIEGIYLAARLFPNSPAIIPAPSFPDYLRAAHAAGLKIPTTDPPHADLPSLATRLSEYTDRHPPVILLGNPNNPTGLLHSRSDLSQLVRSNIGQHAHWIIDEAFIHLVDADSPSLLPELHNLPNVIVIGAWTKSCAIPGLRLGYIATSNQRYQDRLRALQPPWSVNGPASLWARTHLNERLPLILRQHARQIASERAHLIAAINALPGLKAYPSATNFFLVQSNTLPGETLRDSLGFKGILLRDHQGLRMDSNLSRSAVRTREENMRLIEALTSSVTSSTVSRPAHPAKKLAKVIAVLGSSSNSGKSWVATALCRLLANRGFRVAPFKAQNMSNNSAATPCGAEIGRAQAAQAEACRIAPSPLMNPVLLKPAGNSSSQLVVLGKAQKHIPAREYYQHIEPLRTIAHTALDHLRENFDVIVTEGAGSPVELNLMDRDIANLDPVRHANGRWLLVTDIEKGGVFAQAAGTWNLIPTPDKSSCIGLVVNKFRGDLSLFANAGEYFRNVFGAPFLGTLPFAPDLQPESEDTLSNRTQNKREKVPPSKSRRLVVRWISFPSISNAQDLEPWSTDPGIDIQSATTPEEIAQADLLILPGSKNTLADFDWLNASGLAPAIQTFAQHNRPIVGVCGGFQMLGETLEDPHARDGTGGTRTALGLLPVSTTFQEQKTVRQVTASFGEDSWTPYEIHMGTTRPSITADPSMTHVFTCSTDADRDFSEGVSLNKVLGTYLHGCFESAAFRRHLCALARPDLPSDSLVNPAPWRLEKERIYDGMADLLARYLNLEPILEYLAR
jgi:adenosylcobyric acid synthase